ncbi:hypothetical protein EB73_27930 [Mycobacterium sp. SWH-M3]|nr:hypothetical protein EB73_27930 [Mycobacterium sp. SWH-M3]
MTPLFIAATLTTISALLTVAHHRRWWPPLSTPAILTGFVCLATALSFIALAIDAAAHVPDQPAEYFIPLMLAILPVLMALTTGGPALVYSLYRDAVTMAAANQTTSPDTPESPSGA